MKLKLTQGLIATILSKIIKKKLGYNIDLAINDLEIDSESGYVRIHINANAQIAETDLQQIILSNLG